MTTAPLEGARVVVTRARAQASSLVALLGKLGAEPIEVATIEVADPSDGGAALSEAVADLERYEWVVLTSTNAVERYVAMTGGQTSGVRHAVVGSATLAALEATALRADLIPDRFVSTALVEAFETFSGPEEGGHRGRILYPSALVTAPTIGDGLRAKGWTVDQVEAYQTLSASVTDSQRAQVAEADAVLFTSGSSVDRFCELVGRDLLPSLVICIGPSTAETAKSQGIDVSAVADPHTIDGLVAALQELWIDR